MFAVPEFVKVIVCRLLLPTATLPKFALLGLELRVLSVATPLPAKASVCGEFPALSRKTMDPVALAADVGVNCTLKLVLWPAGIVGSGASPLIVKPEPEIVAELSVRFEFPLFVMVTF